MTTNITHTLNLTDIDVVLPAEFQILQPSDAHNHAPHALRVVRHKTTEQTYAFDTPQQYLKFVLSISPRRLLADVLTRRHIRPCAGAEGEHEGCRQHHARGDALAHQ